MRMRPVIWVDEANMEVFVSAPSFRVCVLVFPHGSVVGDVLNRFGQSRGVCSDDFYVVTNGRLSRLEDPLQHGAVYHLEARLCGGKGGFGSMLRALGAQIEKTTNREACRDLSGRRLRDVNHEKEMAEWLKKQADRDAEKEQRRLERLQKKLAEPKHQFTDPEFQQQCHDLSERLEDSVLKGLQASSSGQVKVDDASAMKRPNTEQSRQPQKKKKTTAASAAATCFWAGLDDLPSSEEDDDGEEDDNDNGEEEESPSTSSSDCGAAAVTMTTQSLSSADHTPTPVEMSGCHAAETSAGLSVETPTNLVDPTERSSLCEQQQPSCSSLRLSSVSSVEELESLGLEVLKQELMSRGLKCGGTLSERAARLLAVRGVTPDQIDPAMLAKPGKAKKK